MIDIALRTKEMISYNKKKEGESTTVKKASWKLSNFACAGSSNRGLDVSFLTVISVTFVKRWTEVEDNFHGLVAVVATSPVTLGSVGRDGDDAVLVPHEGAAAVAVVGRPGTNYEGH